MKKIFTFVSILFTLNTFSQNLLSPEALWRLGRVSDPQVSPDGKSVLYSVRNYNLTANTGNTDIYKIDIASGAFVPVADSPDDESSAKWSPDGRRITFTLTKDGTTQVWVMDTDGKNKKQVTNVTGGINGYGFSPGANRIWITQDVQVDKTLKDVYPDLPKATGKIYDDLMFRHWTSWADGSYCHIFYADYKEGVMMNEPKDIMKGERYDSPLKPNGGDEQINFSPDGNRIVYTCKKLVGKEYAVSTNSDIYIYNTEKGTTENLTKGNEGYDVDPQYSPDGKKILWMSMATPKYEADRNRIMVHDFASGTNVEATAGFDYSVEGAKWSKDGKLIYFLCGINATDQLWSLDPSVGKASIKQITGDIADHTAFSQGGVKGEVMVTSMMSISMPTELYTIDLKSGNSKQLTFTNQHLIDGITMGKVVKRMIKATDNKDILTWIIYPPGFDSTKKYPTLLYCQGGPQSTVSQFFSYRWNFQLMAANGYIIVAPNRRGLPSFGEAWNREISGDWGGQCMKDYLSAIDEMSKESYVNKDKLGAVGASFGGYSVYWLAGNHNHRFKTFIAHCGVYDLTSMYTSTEEIWFPDFDLGGPYWNTPTPESYTKFSPHLFAKNWDTPILVINNEKDFRVPVGQGMEAFTTARLKDIPARFLCFPDEGHWVTKPQNSVLWQRVFFDWLARTLK